MRRAIAELASAGKVRVEQGRGTFVEEHSVITYNIAWRTRFRKNLLEQGRILRVNRSRKLRSQRRLAIAAALKQLPRAPSPP